MSCKGFVFSLTFFFFFFGFAHNRCLSIPSISFPYTVAIGKRQNLFKGWTFFVQRISSHTRVFFWEFLSPKSTKIWDFWPGATSDDTNKTVRWKGILVAEINRSQQISRYVSLDFESHFLEKVWEKRSYFFQFVHYLPLTFRYLSYFFLLHLLRPPSGYACHGGNSSHSDSCNLTVCGDGFVEGAVARRMVLKVECLPQKRCKRRMMMMMKHIMMVMMMIVGEKVDAAAADEDTDHVLYITKCSRGQRQQQYRLPWISTWHMLNRMSWWVFYC